MNLLGLGFFKNYRTTLNWKDEEIILEPYPEQSFIEQSFGIGFRYIENKLKVIAILKNSNAYKLGIRLHDEIVSINGIKVKSETDFCRINFNKIDNLKLIVQKEEIQNEYNLNRAYFFDN